MERSDSEIDKVDREKAPVLALIVPCYNEQEVIADTDRELHELLREMESAGEISPASRIIYVDDGSRDGTWASLRRLRSASPSTIALLRLAHNAGHQNALLAGLEEALRWADVTVTIDADLQDDPQAIRGMLARWREGADVVYGVRASRETDTWFKRNTALGFYRTMRIMGADTVFNHADFRLMTARAVRELMRYGENNLFLRGIVPRIGYKQDTVSYDRRPRMAGETKYPLRKMVNLAVEGITSFSVRPVRMVFWIGMLFTLVATGILVYVLIRHFQRHTIEGWTSLMISIWFCTGVILMALGIIGEYVGKIYIEAKHRPRYTVSDREV